MGACKATFIASTINRKMFLVKRFKPGAQGFNVFFAADIPTIVEGKVRMQTRAVPVAANRLWIHVCDYPITLGHEIQEKPGHDEIIRRALGAFTKALEF